MGIVYWVIVVATPNNWLQCRIMDTSFYLTRFTIKIYEVRSTLVSLKRVCMYVATVLFSCWTIILKTVSHNYVLLLYATRALIAVCWVLLLSSSLEDRVCARRLLKCTFYYINILFDFLQWKLELSLYCWTGIIYLVSCGFRANRTFPF